MEKCKVLEMAKSLGACALADNVKDMEHLAHLFFTPQGLEFCEKRNFPDLLTFMALDKTDISKYQVYVSKGEIHVSNKPQIALIGNTHGSLTFSGTEVLHTVVLMHGATASIKASGYAVIRIVNIGNCKVTLDIDSTVQIL